MQLVQLGRGPVVNYSSGLLMTNYIMIGWLTSKVLIRASKILEVLRTFRKLQIADNTLPKLAC